jgi:hypothetical protein
VRSGDIFNIKTKGDTVQGISYRYYTLLQRGYGAEHGRDKEIGSAAQVGLSLSTAIAGSFSSRTQPL